MVEIDTEKLYKGLEEIKKEYGDSFDSIFSNSELEGSLLHSLEEGENLGDEGVHVVFSIANRYNLKPDKLGLPYLNYEFDGKELREDRGYLKQEEYGQKLGLDASMISRLENNNKKGSLETVKKVLENSDLTESDLGIDILTWDEKNLENLEIDRDVLKSELLFISFVKGERKYESVEKCTTDLRFLNPLWKRLYESGIPVKIHNNKDYWQLVSSPLPLLDHLKSELIGQNSKRKVPDDFEFSDEILSVFYRNIGCLTRETGKLSRIYLSTYKFGNEALDEIHKGLREMKLETGEFRERDQDIYSVSIHPYSLYRAFKLIGDCPEELREARPKRRKLKYKWPTEEEMESFKEMSQHPDSVLPWEEARLVKSKRVLREVLGENYERLEALREEENLGEVLREIRKEEDLEIKEMCEKIGRNVSNYEVGTSAPPVSILWRYLKETGMNIEKFEERFEDL